MLEETTTNLAITGDATGFLSIYGIAQLLMAVGVIGFFAIVVYIFYQYAKTAKSDAWYNSTRDAYRVGLIKKHASENNVELCYEPSYRRKGLMERLDDDVRRDIGLEEE